MEFKKGEIVNKFHTDVLGTFIVKPNKAEAMKDGSGVALLNKEKNICVKIEGVLKVLKNKTLILPHARIIYTTEDKLEEPIKCTEEKEL